MERWYATSTLSPRIRAPIRKLGGYPQGVPADLNVPLLHHIEQRHLLQLGQRVSAEPGSPGHGSRPLHSAASKFVGICLICG
ncbi:MAG: hypothetical protein ACRDS0_29540 [Pseudonocardiaceae bacterium]